MTRRNTFSVAIFEETPLGRGGGGGEHSKNFDRGKVCSINFEPPDVDLCSACHVYTISCGAWTISTLFIVNRVTRGSK